MGILSKLFNYFLDFLTTALSKIGKRLEKIILGIRYIIIRVFKKFNFNKSKISREKIQNKVKIIIVLSIIFVLTFFYFIFNKNYYHSYLFYPDKKLTTLLAEKRQIIKDNNKKNKIKNIVEELILGPMNSEFYNIFPLDSKLLSVTLVNNNLLLNFNKATIMNIDNESEDNKLVYSYFIKSIVNSICFQLKDIETVKFYFDGKSYKYIGSYGPIDKGIKPDWNTLK
jgi:hypothetical protein